MNTDRPIVFLDIEATGADHTRDRIVELAMIRREPDGSTKEYCERVNPGLRIPAEVVAIHGITNEAVANAHKFRDIAPAVLDFIGDADLAGFGILKFDVPILNEEFRRSSFPFSVENRRLIDALTIFHQKEPRDLTAAYRFYCKQQLVGAHGAMADTKAAMNVIDAQLLHYTDLPQDMDSLNKFCRKQDERYVDSTRKFYWKDGEAAVNFGKHKGETLRDVVKTHRDYLEWLIQDGKFPQDVIDLCWRALRGDFPVKPS